MRPLPLSRCFVLGIYCIWQTEEEGMGKEWSDHENQTEGLQGCRPAFTTLLL